MTFLPICCFDTIIHSVCVCVSARILLLCKCLVLGLRSTIYVRMYCTWSFQVFGTKGAMSLIYTEICNIVVYPDRHIRSYSHNSQAQLLLMGMHVENTVRKLERCCPCLPWNLQSTRSYFVDNNDNDDMVDELYNKLWQVLHNSQAQLLLMAMYVENTVGNWNKVSI